MCSQVLNWKLKCDHFFACAVESCLRNGAKRCPVVCSSCAIADNSVVLCYLQEMSVSPSVSRMSTDRTFDFKIT